MEKRHKFDHHFAKGVAPAEVIMELLNRDGFVSDEQMQKWEDMSLEKKLQYAAKMQQPKVGRPSKHQRSTSEDIGRILLPKNLRTKHSRKDLKFTKLPSLLVDP